MDIELCQNAKSIVPDTVQVRGVEYSFGFHELLNEYHAMAQAWKGYGDEAMFEGALDAVFGKYLLILEGSVTEGIFARFRMSVLYPELSQVTEDDVLGSPAAFSVDAGTVTVQPLTSIARQNAQGSDPDILVQAVVLSYEPIRERSRMLRSAIQIPWAVDPVIILPESADAQRFTEQYQKIFPIVANLMFTSRLDEYAMKQLIDQCRSMYQDFQRFYRYSIRQNPAYADLLAAAALSPIVAAHSRWVSP